MGVILLDTTRNPWRVDATGGALALPLQITGPLGDLVTIDRMEWYSKGAAQGDTVEVLDCPAGVAAGSGRRLWIQSAQGADMYTWQRQKTARPAQGLCVKTLDSGTLLIYYA